MALAVAAVALVGSLHGRVESASAKTWSGYGTRGSAAIGNATVSEIASRSGGQRKHRNRSYDLFPSPAQSSLLPSSASSSSSSSYRRTHDSTRSSPHQKSRRPRPGRRRC